jgi:hypothetical protein
MVLKRDPKKSTVEKNKEPGISTPFFVIFSDVGIYCGCFVPVEVSILFTNTFQSLDF